MSDDHFLSRWSRRKHAIAKGRPPEVPEPARAPSAPAVPAAHSELAPPPEPLPAVESLTPESDFSPFMRDDVDAGLRRQALKTLFQDPRFNVMDGLDVYIDDYSKPDPLPEGWLEKMNQVARLGEYRAPEPPAEPAEEIAGEGAPEGPAEASSEAPPGPSGEGAEGALPDTATTQPSTPEVPES